MKNRTEMWLFQLIFQRDIDRNIANILCLFYWPLKQYCHIAASNRFLPTSVGVIHTLAVGANK